MDIKEAIGQKLLLAFHGKDKPSPEIIHALREYKIGGVSLFRSMNIEDPAQLRALNDSLQRLARDFGLPPLLIATDQEGGQLMAIGQGTQLPGNMALGATGSIELARRAGEVLGRELAAVGVNVNYAPCADVNLNPQNPVVGVRSFGEDPNEVAQLSAAMIEGIQSQGVAATVKHFPGHGDVAGDSHYKLPVVPHSLERLRAVEFSPFRASFEAGAKLVMIAHIGLPAVDGPDAPPATLSSKILKSILREELGFNGIIVTDAMNMHAIRQGEALGEESVRAVAAGADLLLQIPEPQDDEHVYKALVDAAEHGRLDTAEIIASAQRVLALKEWLSQHPLLPDLSVIGCAEHQKIADEIAEASITLVRDDERLLSLHLNSDQRIAVVIPQPQDLTPADTSSYIKPQLAEALRKYHPRVEEFVVPFAPGESDVSGLLQQLRAFDVIVVGTINAFDQKNQAALVRETLKLNIPTIIVALRLPYDLMAFPEAKTYLCTYSILEPSMRALAKAVFGQSEIKGHLPVAIPGVAEAGYSLR